MVRKEGKYLMITVSAINQEYSKATVKQKMEYLAKRLPKVIPLAEYIRIEEEATKEYNISVRIFQTLIKNWDENDTSKGSYFMEEVLKACEELDKAQDNLIKARQNLKSQLNIII